MEAKKSFKRAYELDGECMEALLGLTAVKAIIDYNAGNKESFLLRIGEILKKDATWVGTIYKVMPQLLADKEFMDFIENVKKG